jgi:hypothetical protein
LKEHYLKLKKEIINENRDGEDEYSIAKQNQRSSGFAVCGRKHGTNVSGWKEKNV